VALHQQCNLWQPTPKLAGAWRWMSISRSRCAMRLSSASRDVMWCLSSTLMRNHFIEFDARQQRAHVKAYISLRYDQKSISHIICRSFAFCAIGWQTARRTHTSYCRPAHTHIIANFSELRMAGGGQTSHITRFWPKPNVSHLHCHFLASLVLGNYPNGRQ